MLGLHHYISYYLIYSAFQSVLVSRLSFGWRHGEDAVPDNLVCCVVRSVKAGVVDIPPISEAWILCEYVKGTRQSEKVKQLEHKRK